MSQFKKGTAYTITFAAPLNAQSANDLGLYRLFQGVKKHRQTVFTKALKIKSVVYNPGSHSETITLAKPSQGPRAGDNRARASNRGWRGQQRPDHRHRSLGRTS